MTVLAVQVLKLLFHNSHTHTRIRAESGRICTVGKTICFDNEKTRLDGHLMSDLV